MSAGEIYQFTTVAILESVPVANVFFLEVIDDTGSTDDMLSAAIAIENQIIPKMTAFQSDQLAYECILGRRVFPTTSPARVFAITNVGAQISAQFPANVAISFRHYSGNGTKNQRGRWFIPGLCKLFCENGRISQTHDTLFQVFIDAVIAIIVESARTYRMKHFSKKLNTFYDIESASVNPVPTKVRNRTPGICSIS